MTINKMKFKNELEEMTYRMLKEFRERARHQYNNQDYSQYDYSDDYREFICYIEILIESDTLPKLWKKIYNSYLQESDFDYAFLGDELLEQVGKKRKADYLKPFGSDCKYVLYNSNNEIEVANNNETDFLVGVRTVIINYIVYCMDCNRDNLESLNYLIDELEHLQYNSYDTLGDYKPLFEDYGFKLIIK